MKYVRRLLALGALIALPLGLMADGHEVKKIIINGEEVTGDVDLEAIEEIIQKIEVDDGMHKRIIIAKGGDGNVEVEKIVDDMGPRGPGMRHRKHHGFHMAPPPMLEPLGRDAANCVLKNIRNAQTDAAAMAVVQACRSLNPAD